jgi:predicted flap endonuclease-1-like 5' DNA nuclease
MSSRPDMRRLHPNRRSDRTISPRLKGLAAPIASGSMRPAFPPGSSLWTRAKPNADIEEWQVQAQALMEKYKREGATYHGPPPDDLTAISGIGPTTLDALYHAGICTFDQLAAATPEQLRDVLPAPAVGVEVDYTPWIEQAKRLANGRQQTS